MQRRSIILSGILCLLLLLIPVSSLRHDIPEKDFSPREPKNPKLLAYEPLLREYADSIGWDWRLLASIVYHESRFTNEAKSHKGATGLMQINSSRYSEESLLNPSFNLYVGTAYLKKLEHMYNASSALDTLKFALAAYNMGDGNVRRLVTKTQDAGMDATCWDTVALMLPKGHHTVSYVQKVLDSYDSYRRLYPR